MLPRCYTVQYVHIYQVIFHFGLFLIHFNLYLVSCSFFLPLNSIFDNLLYRPATRDDIPQYEEVQRILREEIVNPLRLNRYVRADKVMKLRRLLQKLSSVTGLTNEEKGVV